MSGDSTAGAFSGHRSRETFHAIGLDLNERPRQTLGFKTPSQAPAQVLR